MERKKNLHLKLEVAFDVKCDLLEVNNVSCFKKYWLEFNRGMSTIKVNTELFWSSYRNLGKMLIKDSLLKIFKFGFYPDSIDVFCCFCLKSTVLELLESFLLTFSVFVYLSGFGLKSLELTFFFIILIIVKVIVFYHLILIGKVSSWSFIQQIVLKLFFEFSVSMYLKNYILGSKCRK